MSYLVLARKWRPQDFSQVVGQGPVVRILRNAIKKQRVPHAMLFSGVRGVGKTTLARIMAKALNCTGETAEPPCNQCESCREITSGTALDLHEIDGASNRGIDEIRELKENIRFHPTKCRYKIIIIDEVHMLTDPAFNALLKTLEEPPAHVIFMFATTEIHKIPVTILSRCQRYELKRVLFAELFAFFKKIAGDEGVSISDSALEMIATEASGSVRDGLSLLDQVFSFGEDRMTDIDVREVLGLVDRQVFFRLMEVLLAGELSPGLEILDQVSAAGADLKRFTSDLLNFSRSLIICRVVDNPGQLLDGSDHELAAMSELAAKYTPETLYRLFDLLLKGAAEMQYAPHPRLVLEMTFARALQTGQIVPVSDLIGRLDALLKGGGGLVSAGASLYTAEPVAGPPIRSPDVPEKKTPEIPVEPLTDPEPVGRAEEAAGLEPPSVPGSVAAKGGEKDGDRDVRGAWDGFVDYVKDRRKWMAPVLQMCNVMRIQGDDLVMKYEDHSDCSILLQKDNLKNLTEFAQDYFQHELRVRIIARDLVSQEGKEGNGDGPQEERRALANDPLVQMTSEVFGGRVAGIRTGPRSREIKVDISEE
ncbi:MAG: DNA polymerase III subunit gamma/tau [Proteobacteria bacterium]|nr:DNA polymerase III subunit gamma/tau [Pseudomonadota bacterium]MBU1738140.1 DNA polymerase III subunit gamma/tau [Pseudomonadota bacterium]